MKFLAASASLVALSALTSVAAEDVLYSRRLQKRGIDADGNFNMCG
jgi:hypothetical protein